MFLPPNKSQDVIQHHSCYCLENECLDDITADLVSLTLSDLDSSSFNVDTKNLSFRSTSETNCDNSYVHTTKDTPSPTPVTLDSHSEKNHIFSSTEMLTQHGVAQTSKTCDFSSQNVVRASETVKNKNEKCILSSWEHTVAEQSTSAQNIYGSTQFHISQDKNTIFPKCKLSLSLHDVSRLTDFPLKSKSRDFSSDTIKSQSVTTISSGLKSKDSGLPRSVSCFSLNSGGKNYEHVQSKVKEYIRQIKEADERRKSLTLGDISSTSINADGLNIVSDENNCATIEKPLTAVIRDLHNELRERDIVLAKLQDNYDKLLIKCAEAENKIDYLRFKVGDRSLELASQKEDLHVCDSEKSVRKDSSKFTSPCQRTSDMSENATLLPSDVRYTSNDEIQTYKKVRSPVTQSRTDTRQNLTLNPLVKPHSTSLRLDKRLKSLSNNATVQSCKSELSDISGISNGRSSSETTCKSSLTESNKMCVTHDNISRAASCCHRSICQSMDNVLAQGGQSCEDVYEFDLSQSRLCREMPVASDIKIPEYASYCNEPWLCKKWLEQSVTNHPSNSFEKVSRWQESLPPFELIEPKCYASCDCHSSESKTSNHNFIKKFTSSGGRDSGCPCSELYSSTVCPNSVKLPSSQGPKCMNDVIGAKDLSLITEPETVAQPVHHKIAFKSLPCDKTVPCDGRKLDNGGEFNLPVIVSYSVKLSECSQNTVIPNLLNIDSCECWNPEVELTGASNKASIQPELYDQKPNNMCQDFHIPPLKLGSLLCGDDSSVMTQSIYSSGVTAVSETEEMSKADLCSIYEESLSSSRKDTSEDVTYPSSTYVTSDSLVYKALNTVNSNSNKVYPSSFIASNMDNQKQLNYNYKTYSKESERKQYHNVQFPKDNTVESRMSNKDVQNGSVQASVTASTSYRSIEPCKLNREVQFVANRHCAEEPAHFTSTNGHGILSNIPVQQEGCQSSVDAVEAVKSCEARRKLLGSAVRYCLLELLNAENCFCSNCICHSSSRKPVSPRNNMHCASIRNDDASIESDGRNISYTSTPVNLTSKVSDVECGAKKTLTADMVVSSAVEAANQEDLNCDSGGVNDVDSTVIPAEVKCNLLVYLHEMDQFAQQLKARSETILNILAVQLNNSTS